MHAYLCETVPYQTTRKNFNKDQAKKNHDRRHCRALRCFATQIPPPKKNSLSSAPLAKRGGMWDGMGWEGMPNNEKQKNITYAWQKQILKPENKKRTHKKKKTSTAKKDGLTAAKCHPRPPREEETFTHRVVYPPPPPNTYYFLTRHPQLHTNWPRLVPSRGIRKPTPHAKERRAQGTNNVYRDETTETAASSGSARKIRAMDVMETKNYTLQYEQQSTGATQKVFMYVCRRNTKGDKAHARTHTAHPPLNENSFPKKRIKHEKTKHPQPISLSPNLEPLGKNARAQAARSKPTAATGAPRRRGASYHIMRGVLSVRWQRANKGHKRTDTYPAHKKKKTNRTLPCRTAQLKL